MVALAVDPVVSPALSLRNSTEPAWDQVRCGRCVNLRQVPTAPGLLQCACQLQQGDSRVKGDWMVIWAAVGIGVAGEVAAYPAGTVVLRSGGALVQPREQSSALALDGVALPGTGAAVGDDTQLGIAATYMVTSHWGLGLLVATPFEHDLRALGVGADAGSVQHLPPTLTLQYFPREAASAWQPYVGVGVNYTWFFDEEVGGELMQIFGDGDLTLDSSWGWAGQLGVDFRWDDHWLLGASLWYLDIDTEATFRFPAHRVTAAVAVDPWVYMLGVGYTF